MNVLHHVSILFCHFLHKDSAIIVTKKTDKILGRSYGQLVQIQIMLNESVPLLILFSVEEEQNFKFDKNLIRRKIEILNWTRHRRDALASRFCVIKIRSEDNKIVCG